MREFAKISPQFWINEQGKKIKKLGVESQLIALYLLTNPHANMIGIYYLPIAFISHEVGLTHEEANDGLQNLMKSEFCSYDHDTEYVWVHEFAFEQIGEQLKYSDNRVKAINDAFSSLPTLPFLEKFYDKYAKSFFIEPLHDHRSTLGGSLDILTSKEKKKKKDKEKKNISLSGTQDFHFSSMHDFKSQAIEVLNFLNEKTQRVYRPVDSNLKLIIARLKSGASVMNCRQVIAKKSREWKSNEKMAEYLRPATLFNATKFEQYLGELIQVDEGNNYEQVS